MSKRKSRATDTDSFILSTPAGKLVSPKPNKAAIVKAAKMYVGRSRRRQPPIRVNPPNTVERKAKEQSRRPTNIVPGIPTSTSTTPASTSTPTQTTPNPVMTGPITGPASVGPTSGPIRINPPNSTIISPSPPSGGTMTGPITGPAQVGPNAGPIRINANVPTTRFRKKNISKGRSTIDRTNPRRSASLNEDQLRRGARLRLRG